MASRNQTRPKVTALRIKQWLKRWDSFEYDPEQRQAKPHPYFFIFSMDARELRALAGVNKRKRLAPGVDLGIQRKHEESRSQEIARYVRNGYPFSILSEVRREEPENEVLRKPGWLPTAVVVNILTEGDRRNGLKVAKQDLVLPGAAGGSVTSISLPVGFRLDDWSPTALPPLEVIDGQHRLWAFDASTPTANFDLPVVAFLGLDISWQAYLFWTINIKPKKINPSLAFDLYPLLRTEDWLDVQDEIGIYRETRAQELVELLWSYPESAWYQRIDMIGERGRGYVSQASFVRSMLATLIRRREGRGISIGGLFGATLAGSSDPLKWNRPQQTAFVILFWNLLRDAVAKAKAQWVKDLRDADGADRLLDAAFLGRQTLLNQDQGVRVVLHVLNDLTFLTSDRLQLQDWEFDQEGDPSDLLVVRNALTSLRAQDFVKFCSALAKDLAAFDWRSANAPGLTTAQRRDKLIYRGSGGYRILRLDLLNHLAKSKDAVIRTAARQVRLRTRGEKT
jgi:DGQHR domain-containing protein